MKSINLNTLFLFIVAACYMWHTEGAICDPKTGPNGGKHCVKFSNYFDYQWATCHTNSYIKLITNYRHQCSHRSSGYCYNQCMLEKYEVSNGQVFSSCRCNPNSASQQGMHAVVLVLLAMCFMFMI